MRNRAPQGDADTLHAAAVAGFSPGRVTACNPRAHRASRTSKGGEPKGGQRHPSPAAVFNTACAGLTDLKAVGQPCGTPAKNIPLGIARSNLDEAVAGKLPGLSVASLTGDEGDGQPVMSLCDGRAACRTARIRPYPYPSET